jgi:glutathione S-transferase
MLPPIMSPPLELFVFPSTIFPRRVLIYLQEKGLADSDQIQISQVSLTETGQMVAPGKPPGSVPMLRLPSGKFIKQSIAIIDYFEDICDSPYEPWQVALNNAARRQTMRGSTPEQRARNRDMLCLIDEASSYFTLACHKGTVLFQAMEETNADAARLLKQKCRATLALIDPYYEGWQPAHGEGKEEISTDDCVLFALLEFAGNIYGVDFFKNGALPHMAAFYKDFGSRSSAVIAEEHWKQVEGWAPLAKQWL